jgi:pimeloyl-ACP methyl ester carboxylesterase
MPRWAGVQTRRAVVAGTTLAYRELGPRGGVPVVLLNHWGAALDDIDPRIATGLAHTRHVVAIDYRGMGASGGSAPLTVAAMAHDVIALLGALGHARVDLLGFSLGGFVAQDVAVGAPGLVRKLILAGTGPAGGRGIERVGAASWPLMLKGLVTLRDPRTYLFFPRTATGRQAARAFLDAVGRRLTATPRAFLRQREAIEAWGRQAAQPLENLRLPVLIVNGDDDRMVPSALSHALARRIAGAQLVIYPDAGHGSLFQYHDDFTARAAAFLADAPGAPARASSTLASTTA